MQVAGSHSIPAAKAGFDRAGVVNMEGILDKAKRTPCVALMDLGLDKDTLRKRLIQWAMTGIGAHEPV